MLFFFIVPNLESENENDKMNGIKLAKVLSLVVILTGIAVMIGWIFDIAPLKSMLPIWVTMKFTTAFSFFLSGITLFVIAGSLERQSVATQLVLPLTSLMLLLLMGTLLASVFLCVRTGIEDLFVREEGVVKTMILGQPSAGTMINFILMATSGLLTLLAIENLILKLKCIGWVVSFIGTVAILGYLIDRPFLYYSIQDWSTAMAFHTAALFVLLGVGLIIIRKE